MSMEKILKSPRIDWLHGEGNDTDVVLSSRVRLARNLESRSFPNRSNSAERLNILKEIEKSKSDLNSAGSKKFFFTPMDELSEADRWTLMEKHLISPQLAAGEIGQGLLVRDDSVISIMINEEDHLRIQGMSRGLALEEAFEQANSVDDTLGNRHSWAFRSDWGYLTACPTNVGTGMRGSVMLHLPALTLRNQINQLAATIQPHGMVIRGLDGEGSESRGHIFQLSNQVTLGQSEEEILKKLNQVTKQVIEYERKMREEMNIDLLADRAGRAYGILKYAHQISSEEALDLASWVRLGRSRNTLPTGKEGWFEELLVAVRPYFLQRLKGAPISNSNERDQIRAQWLREKIDG